MSTESTVMTLKNYLDYAGILACNENPYIKCLSDIGCGWEDVSALINTYELFYCKAYRKRTIYLSPKAYYLLKSCKRQKPMDESAACIYDLMDQGPMDMETIRLLVCMDKKHLNKSFTFLLENLYATAMLNGRILNRNWSTYEYGTDQNWEAHVKRPVIKGDPRVELKAVLTRTMPEEEFDRLVR